jgi:hypothetical protein
VIPAVLLAVLLQSDPVIEKVERIAGPVQRPLRWAPLAVELHAPAGAWSGDVLVRSGFGFSTARRVELAAGGRARVVLPALDPQAVEAGKSSRRVPRASARADRVVGVEAGLPYAVELASDAAVHYVPIAREDLKALLAQGLLDAFDLVLAADAAGLAGTTEIVAAPTREAAERALALRTRPADRIEAVDAAAWSLAPEEGWVPAKRRMALFFAAVYGLAGFAALVTLARRSARWAAGATAALAILGAGAYGVCFPRGQLWVRESACEAVPLEGEARISRLWFVGAAAELRTSIEFPRVVKPVFPRSVGAEQPFVLRVGEGPGSRVEELPLPAGGTACFAALEAAAPSMRPAERVPLPLYRASILLANRNRELGDLRPGDALPSSVAEDAPAPRDPAFQAFRRFVATDCVFGWLEREERPADAERSPDLADARAHPRFFVGRLR